MSTKQRKIKVKGHFNSEKHFLMWNKEYLKQKNQIKLQEYIYIFLSVLSQEAQAMPGNKYY